MLYSGFALLVCSGIGISADEMVFAEGAGVGDSEVASKMDFVVTDVVRLTSGV